VTVEDSGRESVQEFKAQDFEEDNSFVLPNRIAMVQIIGQKIERGASTFLRQEYCFMTVFIILFGAVVLILVDFYGEGSTFRSQCYAFVAFLAGCITSMICGFVGLTIAVKANYRVAFLAS
jgi:inorganic pyrophosphatase